MPQDTPRGDGEAGREADPATGVEDVTATPETDNPWARPGQAAEETAPQDSSTSGAADEASPATPAAATPAAATPAAATPAADGQHPQDPSPQDPSANVQGQYTQEQYPTPEQYPQGASAQGPYGQSPYGQSPYAQSPYAQNPYAQNPYAQSPYARGSYPQYPQNPYGPGAPDPYGTGPYGAGQYPQNPNPTAALPAYGPYPPGQTQPGWSGGPPPPSRRGRTGRLVAAGVALALVAGGVGGAIDAEVARPSGSSDGGVLSDPLPGAESDLPMSPIEQVAQKVLPSVVQLRVEGGAMARGEQGEGSGMVVSPDGLVLTNNHVVEPAVTGGALRAVFQDGRTSPMRIIGRDPQSDLAVVKADNVAGLVPVALGNSDGVRVGQQVTAFGSPLGLGGSVTTGIVSALDRAVSVGPEQGASAATVLSALQTDAAINPGNSGGPLVDMQGRVVGINSAIATTGGGGGSIGVGFSIPINQAKRIADQLRANQRATHAVLGVEVTDDPLQTGARLRTVAPGGAAARAGMRPGELVVRLDDQRITTGTELQAAVRSQVPGATVQLQLSDRTVPVTLGED